MKKLISYSLAIVVCLAAGCKKDKQNNRIHLLKQQITDQSIEGLPIDTATYTYDDQNRITNIIDGVPPRRVTFTFKYDNDNRISIARKYNTGSGALIIEFDFYYTPNGSGYYFYGPTHVADTATFIYSDKNQLAKIQTIHSGSQVFTYDNRGNINSSEAFLPDGTNDLFNKTTYVYDDKKNPFSDISPYNYYFMYVAYYDPSTHINNVIIKNADTYTYTYNTDGFPVKAWVNTDKAIFPIYYNYIVK